MKIDKLTEQILEITNNSDYGWIHSDSADAERIRLVLSKALSLGAVSHSMTGDGMNCLEFFDMIKKEWCVSEEQYKPFLNDVLIFARKYHKERKEYCG